MVQKINDQLQELVMDDLDGFYPICIVQLNEILCFASPNESYSVQLFDFNQIGSIQSLIQILEK